MHLRWLALAALLLAVPTASACQGVPLSVIRLDFPESNCPDPARPSRLALDECVPVPESGQEVRLEGRLTWQWQVECTVPLFPPTAEEVVIHLRAWQDHAWLRLEAEPSTVRFTLQDTEPDLDPASPETPVHVEYEAAVEAVVSRGGDPDGAAAERIRDQDGVVRVVLQAEQEPTTSIPAAVNVAVFRLNATALAAPEPTLERDSPAMPWPVLLVVLAVVLARGRP